MRDITPDETASVLIGRFPRCSALDTSEGPYTLLGEFALFVRGGIDAGSLSGAELDNVFSFLNDLGMSSSTETHNQLVVGVLEILADSSKCISEARRGLQGHALALFERVIVGWNQT